VLTDVFMEDAYGNVVALAEREGLFY
jgi:hypothetical protein